MNWKREAENDLKNYSRRIESLNNAKEKIKALQDQMLSVRAGISDSTPVQGGGNRSQETMINCIAEIERLELTITANDRLVRLVEKGLAGLSPEEQKVLELFYIYRTRGHVERLMEILNLEQAQIYRIKDAALYKFTIAIYGIIDY